MLNSIKRLVRPIYRSIFPRSNAVIFDRIYKERQWLIGDDPTAEFYSGTGSYDPSVKEYTDLVKQLITDLGIKSVVEIGCGDFAVASKYVDACQSYIGIDVVRRLVDHNERKYGRERVKFLWKDASKSKLPISDLCIIRQVLQHLPNKDILAILRNVSSKYLIITEHLPSIENTGAYNLDKDADAGIRVPRGSGVFIDKSPFNLNAKIILEKNVVSDIHAADERLVTWLVFNELSRAIPTDGINARSRL
jgi:Methyltransferase domain